MHPSLPRWLWIFASFALVAPTTCAKDFAWVGQAPSPNQHDWSNALNWKDAQNNNGVPGASDNAAIGGESNGAPVGFTVTLSQAVTVTNLSLYGTTLSGPDLIVAGTFLSESSTMTGPGSTTLQGISTIKVATNTNFFETDINGRNIINSGTLTVKTGAALVFVGSKTVVTNNGTINIEDNVTISSNTTAANVPEIDNAVTLAKPTGAGTAQVLMSGLIKNLAAGTVRCDSGTLQFNGPQLDHSGTFLSSDLGNLIQVRSALAAHDGAKFNGLGLTTLEGSHAFTVDGTVKVQGHLEFGEGTSGTTGSLTLSQAVPGTLEVFGGAIFDWTGGTMTQFLNTAGKVQVDKGAVMNISGSNFDKILSAATIETQAPDSGQTNGGRIVWTGAGQFRFASSAVLNNGGVFEAQNDVTMSGFGSGPFGTFNNLSTGTFLKSVGSGGSQTGIGIPFNSQDTVLSVSQINVSQGTLKFFPGSDGTMNAALVTSAGSVIQFSGGTHTVTSPFFGNANVQGAGKTLVDNGTLQIDDNFNVGNGSGVGTFELSGFGNLRGVGFFAIGTNATFNWTGGSMLDAGVTYNAGHLNISGDNDKTITDRKLINAPASVIWSGLGRILCGGNAVMENNTGGTFEIQNNVSMTNSGHAQFLNFGTVTKTAGTATTFFNSMPVYNAGTIEVDTGTIEFTTIYRDKPRTPGDPISGDGKIVEKNGGTIRFDLPASIDNLFDGVFGTLNAGNGLTVNGTLSGDNETVNGTVDIEGTLELGDAPGIFNLSGVLTHGTRSTLSMPINGTNALTPDFGQLKSTANITLGGTLSPMVLHSFIPATSDTFTIVTTTKSIGGAFRNVANGARVNNPDGSGSFLVTTNTTTVSLSQYALPSTNFSQWQSAHFTPAQISDPTISGLLADPDHDGLNNLLEYALNSDPNDPISTNRPTASIDSTYLSIIYTKNLGATDLTYAVEQSLNLLTWSPVTPTNVVLFDNGFIQTIQARVPRTNAGSSGKLFLQLRVTKQ